MYRSSLIRALPLMENEGRACASNENVSNRFTFKAKQNLRSRPWVCLKSYADA